MRSVVLCIVAFLLLTPYAQAHLAAGEDRQIGDVKVDFGYAPEDLTAGESSTITVGVAKGGVPTTEPVWIRISRGDDVTFSSEIAPSLGVASLAYTFAQGGAYEITVRGEGVETTFTVDVHADLPWLAISIAALAGLLIGVLAGWKLKV